MVVSVRNVARSLRYLNTCSPQVTWLWKIVGISEVEPHWRKWVTGGGPKIFIAWLYSCLLPALCFLFHEGMRRAEVPAAHAWQLSVG